MNSRLTRRTLVGAAGAGMLAGPAGRALAGPAAEAGGPAAPDPAISSFEQASGGRIGVFAQNTRSGARLAWRSDERFVMCSTFKASLAALVLRAVDQHRDDLSERLAFGDADMQDWYAPIAQANLQRGSLTVGEMCAAAVEHSDNTCASLLLKRVGGPAAVTAFWRGIGDTTSRLDDPEPVLNRTPLGGARDTTTPRAMAETIGKLALGDVLSPPSRRRLTAWLIAGRTGDDRLRLGLPRAWTVGDKTGNNGKDAAGDLAIAWAPAGPLVIAAFTRGGQPTSQQFRTVFEAVGRLAAARLA